ncbi:MAG: Nucleotidyl transferase [Parcubacteria group bacterium GW2011_GWA2_50_10b]|nr:MAG: Nucleotidyl transferase [Parcubacteria group bacterium GW2011_GWA2_50_10b]
MKAVILAGGTGTRLHPLTLAVNKHLLPVFDKPVIYHAIEKLVDAGISKIMIVTSPHHIDSFVKLLGSGQHFRSRTKKGKQIQIVYAIQNEPSGIAHGLYFAEDYIGNDNCVLFLGDNIIMDNIAPSIKKFKKGASVFLKKVRDPERFGVATIDSKGKVTGIEEKPVKPKSNLAVTGLYIYDNTVFKKIRQIPKSKRGEYEITDLNNLYIKEGTLNSHVLKKEWFDIGTIHSLHEASVFMRKKSNNERKI